MRALRRIIDSTEEPTIRKLQAIELLAQVAGADVRLRKTKKADEPLQVETSPRAEELKRLI